MSNVSQFDNSLRHRLGLSWVMSMEIRLECVCRWVAYPNVSIPLTTCADAAATPASAYPWNISHLCKYWFDDQLRLKATTM